MIAGVRVGKSWKRCAIEKSRMDDEDLCWRVEDGECGIGVEILLPPTWLSGLLVPVLCDVGIKLVLRQVGFGISVHSVSWKGGLET